MKLLNYEDCLYKITDKEMDKLNSMLSKISLDDLDDLEKCEKENDIADYIDSKIESKEYKCIGFIDFNYRR